MQKVQSVQSEVQKVQKVQKVQRAVPVPPLAQQPRPSAGVQFKDLANKFVELIKRQDPAKAAEARQRCAVIESIRFSSDDDKLQQLFDLMRVFKCPYRFKGAPIPGKAGWCWLDARVSLLDASKAVKVMWAQHDQGDVGGVEACAFVTVEVALECLRSREAISSGKLDACITHGAAKWRDAAKGAASQSFCIEDAVKAHGAAAIDGMPFEASIEKEDEVYAIFDSLRADCAYIAYVNGHFTVLYQNGPAVWLFDSMGKHMSPDCHHGFLLEFACKADAAAYFRAKETKLVKAGHVQVHQVTRSHCSTAQ